MQTNIKQDKMNVAETMKSILATAVTRIERCKELRNTYTTALVGESWILTRHNIPQSIEGNCSIPKPNLVGFSVFDKKNAHKIAENFSDTSAVHIVVFLDKEIEQIEDTIKLIESHI